MVADGCRVLVSTAPADAAPRIARTLVEERLAACVNVLPGARSVYRWQGEICDDAESLLIIKTTAARGAELRERLKALHPYELPELIAIELAAGEGSAEYLAWVRGETARP